MLTIYFKNTLIGRVQTPYHLYHIKGGFVYYWLPAHKVGSREYVGRWQLSVMGSAEFVSMVSAGTMVPVGEWVWRIYGPPIDTPVTVPDCYSLRALVEKYPPRTKVTFKEIQHD